MKSTQSKNFNTMLFIVVIVGVVSYMDKKMPDEVHPNIEENSKT